MPSKQDYVNIFVDKLTNSLNISGYRRVHGNAKNDGCDEIVLRLSGSYRSLESRKVSDRARPVHTLIRSLLNTKKSKQSNNKIERSSNSSINKLLRNYTTICNSTEGIGLKTGIANLFYDEDEWDYKQLSHPEIIANGWVPMKINKFSFKPDQVLLYIHGYNLTLSEACAQMAHIISFSKLPPYILPFVFNWDGHHLGKLSAFGYPLAFKCANAPNLSESFNELLREFICIGIKHVHILVHSCGARVFFNVLGNAINKGLITPVLDDVCSTEMSVRMDTLILVNPDYSLKRFRDYDYFTLRGYCNHIVMYVDSRDQCLTFSELYNRERSLGRSIFGMRTTPSKLESMRTKHHSETCSISIGDPQTLYTGEVVTTKIEPIEYKSKSMTDKYIPTPTQVDDKCQCSSICQAYYSNKSLNESHFFIVNRINSLKNMEDDKSYNDRTLWLDMDVVDTTTIDTNVDFLKHSFYQMKREIMDDIRDVILMHSRAEYRQTRLDRRRGNVYVFRVAPSNVNSLFGS